MPHTRQGAESSLDAISASPTSQLGHGPSRMPLIALAPTTTRSPCRQRPALRIRWDQTQDNTNEVTFAADSSCKEMRSQSSQPEGSEMLINSGQAERKGGVRLRLG